MKVLITGGSGTLGKEITNLVFKKKYEVNILTRNKNLKAEIINPPFLKDTTEGVVRFPSGFAIILLSVPSRTATAELVVPKSIPMILDIIKIPRTLK